MREPDRTPVLPSYLTDLGHVLGVVESLARAGGKRPTHGAALKTWYDLVFAVWCWVKEGNRKALSAYLGQRGAGGRLAWESLCDVVGRPLVMRHGRSFDAMVYAFPITLNTRDGDIVGRLRLSSARLPLVQRALAGMFTCEKAWFLPELLSADVVKDLSYLDHLKLTESIVAAGPLPAFVRRPPTRVSPGLWRGLLVVWHDSFDVKMTPADCSKESLARLQAALEKALPDGLKGEVSIRPITPYLDAAIGDSVSVLSELGGLLTVSVKN